MSTTQSSVIPAGALLTTPQVYFQIPLRVLRLDSVTAFDLYIESRGGQAPVLYRRGHLRFTEEARERLEDNKVLHLLVNSVQRDSCRLYLESHLGTILRDTSVPLEERSTLLYDSAKGLIKEVMEDPRSGENFRRAVRVVESGVDFLFGEEQAFPCLMRITSYDYYTFTHCVNVFVFSTALAQRASLPEEQIREFGKGALLHDIGKSMMDPAITKKEGKLTAEEWREMQMHPVHGEDILRELGVTNEIALDVARHHHEKLHGKGYPDALQADAISPWTRICTIADIFDALTTKRSYKDARSSFWSLHLMKTEMEDELDAQYFNEFIELIGGG